jgi:hypothetical protein
VTLLRGRRDEKFWNYHKRKLTDAGVGFSRLRLASALAVRLLRATLNPYETIEKKRHTKNALPQAAALATAKRASKPY